MKSITIDKEKCTHCGLCVSDCITDCIGMGDDNFPEMKNDKFCISCQHCLSICPSGALSFCDKKPENSEPINTESLLSLIKARKSIRQYKDEEIDKETFDKIKAMLPYIPTGCNSHALHFSIVESKSAMDIIRNTVNKKIIDILKSKPISPIYKKFSKYLDSFVNGEDVIFRNAPHMIVVSSPIKAPCAKEDPIIALSYIELYAQSLGLGTCWCGFAQICMKLFPELSAMLEIPSGYFPVYTMLLGKSSVKYSRTTQPEDYKISSIKEIEKDKGCLFCHIKRFVTNIIR